MCGGKLSSEEVIRIRGRFPDFVETESSVWEGKIDFNRTYHDYWIRGDFWVRIVIPDDYPKSARLPLVYDIRGRGKDVKKRHEGKVKDLRDLHQNSKDGAICLCIRQEEKKKFPPGSDILYLIDKLVVPYFFGLQYFDENEKWPWPTYSHGGLGLLEYHRFDLTKQTTESIKELATFFREDINLKKYRKQIISPDENKNCICGERKPFGRCHPEAWQGLMRLHEDMQHLRINPNKLFRRLS